LHPSWVVQKGIATASFVRHQRAAFHSATAMELDRDLEKSCFNFHVDFNTLESPTLEPLFLGSNDANDGSELPVVDAQALGDASRRKSDLRFPLFQIPRAVSHVRVVDSQLHQTKVVSALAALGEESSFHESQGADDPVDGEGNLLCSPRSWAV